MPAGDFFDTNILVYSTSPDQAKAQTADSLIAAGGTISVQVLNEFVNVARRKILLEWAEIVTLLDAIRLTLTVVPLDEETHDVAVFLARRYRLRIYDAAIAASALRTGCSRLITEDLHDGLLIEGRLRVVNPFAARV